MLLREDGIYGIIVTYTNIHFPTSRMAHTHSTRVHLLATLYLALGLLFVSVASQAQNIALAAELAK